MNKEKFKQDLECELDKLFPKGKSLARSEALVLYAQAVILFDNHTAKLKKKIEGKRITVKEGDEMVFGYNKALDECLSELNHQ